MSSPVRNFILYTLELYSNGSLIGYLLDSEGYYNTLVYYDTPDITMKK